MYNREGDSSDCQSAVTQTHSPSVSPLHRQLHSLGQGQYMSRHRQTDGPDHAPMHLWTWSHTYIHPHTSKRNMSFSNAFTWALFALVNVNISTIFTPASILPGWTYSARDLDASQIELTWFFFFCKLHKPYLNILPQLGDEVKTDKLSRGLHTVFCVIGCVSSDFILARLLGHDECVCADWLAGYWHGVCVCVCAPAQSVCEDGLVSVYPTPPSVSDEQNTYVIWKKGTYHPPSPSSSKTAISNLFWKGSIPRWLLQREAWT